MSDDQYNPNYLPEFTPVYKKPDGTYVSHYVEITYDVEHEFVELGKVVDPTKPITVTLDDGKSLSRSMVYPLATPATDYFYFEQESNRIWLDASYIGARVTVGFNSAGDVIRNKDVTSVADVVDNIQQFLEGPHKQFLEEYSKYKNQFDEWDKEYTNLLPLPRQIKHMQQQIDYILKMLREIVMRIGTPSDGTYDDGYLGGISPVRLFPSDSVADGIDKLNEALKEIYIRLRLCRDPIFENNEWEATYAYNVVYANNLGYGLIGGLEALVTKLGNPITFKSDITSSVEYILYFDKNTDELQEKWEVPLGEDCDYPEKVEYDGNLVKAEIVNPEKYMDIFASFYNGRLNIEFKAENLNEGYSTLRVSFRTDDNNIKLFENNSFMIEDVVPIEFDENAVVYNVINQNYKYISGIAYLQDADIEINLPQINNLVQHTLKVHPISISLINGGNIGNLSYADLWGRVPEAWETLPSKYLTFPIPQNKIQMFYDKVRLSMYNVFNSRYMEFDFPYWINNASCTGSNWLREDFCSETYRLPLDNYDTLPDPAMNVWDSTQPVIDQAIVYVNKLVHPNYIGNLQTSPEHIYSMNSTEPFVDYIRMFKGNQPRNNGILEFTGDFDFGINLKAYIKLPGQTGWLDLTKYYDLRTFTGADGDGASTQYETTSNGIKVYWTAGTNSTAYTNFSYMLKISIQDGCYLDKVEEIGW